MKTTRHLTFILSLAAFQGVIGSQEISETEFQQLNLARPFSSIVAKDGIDESEANYLTHWYFLKYGGVCGFPSPVRKIGNWWVADTVIGPQGAAAGTIRIHAERGVLTWLRGPGKWMAPPWKELEKTVAMFTEPPPDAEVAQPEKD